MVRVRWVESDAADVPAIPPRKGLGAIREP